ncbi:S-methyl-5-thioribose-1-phosphate isomerase [Paracoccaceae bacterium]|nr:S-methyl-5-thioribose-1-phosphate isomerase [Paracoccaceae bacterium]
MRVNGVSFRSIWYDKEEKSVRIIDQRWLPYEFRTVPLKTRKDFAIAISDMWVRGAPLIGATAAYAIAEEMAFDPSNKNLESAWIQLNETRPTAINLRWALTRCKNALEILPENARAVAAMNLAHDIAEEDVAMNQKIGMYTLDLIKKLVVKKPNGAPVNILTHCNAGWLATVDWGTATSGMYQAHDAGIPIHIWVDETRPRNQGGLTSWELGSHGIPHTYITDNAGGHLMQHGKVDMVIVGTDRTTASGDVCNKIGTYLKALAAFDNDVPFYVALPSPTIDWTVTDGVKEIPIEERPALEVSQIMGISPNKKLETVQITPLGTETGNPAFDVTPNRLITGLITERGIAKASSNGLMSLFPEFKGKK